MRQAITPSKIKKRLERYVDLVAEVRNQCERLTRLENAKTSPPGGGGDGMPRGSRPETSRVQRMLESEERLQQEVYQAIDREEQEHAALEALFCMVPKADERQLLRLRYFDSWGWYAITEYYHGHNEDFALRYDVYRKRISRLHTIAIQSLAQAASAMAINEAPGA